MAVSSSPGPWVAHAAPKPYAHIRLFCFPYAGGGTRVYRNWPSRLPDTIDVLAVKLPGREDRFKEPPFTCLVTLAQTFADALVRYLDRPFAFFGHSVGALLAFEVAHALREKYQLTPAHLFVSANRAPHLPANGPPVHNLPKPAFIQYLRRLNGASEQILNGAYIQMLLPTLRADIAMSETYSCTHKRPLHCSISALGGLEDTTVSRQSLLAWARHTDSAFDLQMFQGAHFFLQSVEKEILDYVVRTLADSA